MQGFTPAVSFTLAAKFLPMQGFTPAVSFTLATKFLHDARLYTCCKFYTRYKVPARCKSLHP